MIDLVDNTDIIINLIKSAVRNALNEMGIVGVAEVQSNAPVDTGELRSSYTFTTKDFECTIGTDIEYSVWVEFKPKNMGGRPHFRKALESQVNEFAQILGKHLGANLNG